MDDRLIDAPERPNRFARKRGLDFFTTGDNHDYLADEILLLEPGEADAALAAGDTAYDLLRNTARRCLTDPRRLAGLGIPDWCRPLLEWSVENEWDDFLFGRFDLAGGLDGLPLKVLEFNADTCSLLPETGILQPEVLKKNKVKYPAPNNLASSLEARLREIGAARKGTHGLFAHLGYPEDELNVGFLADRASAAGWKQVLTAALPEATFDPDNGLAADPKPERTQRYYYLFKFFPWDWIALEESALWEMLEEMIVNHFVRVVNPAWTMLLQSKGLLAYAWQDNPGHPLLLPTAFDPADLPNPRSGYVRKPVFGRNGENVMVSLDGRRSDATHGGDYGDLPVIYQQLAPFANDREGIRYQLGTFVTPRASALSCRRQDGLILDDDAEFVSLGLTSCR
ncbi:glutathionylspermidine synthase family protein [Lewinella sp. IMCC34191]|uniref:glutathionylspermidine synthase family protein n=1 Tax=Lewinella sp. IMCC34191 TaxID=2259172 RepID=UPI0013008025|nr:glutathionylspermidine synthase family protein [Lewinella sp. IMCC34191]